MIGLKLLGGGTVQGGREREGKGREGAEWDSGISGREVKEVRGRMLGERRRRGAGSGNRVQWR